MLLTTGQLGLILGLSDGQVDNEGLMGGWPRRNRRYIVSGLPLELRKKVEAHFEREAGRNSRSFPHGDPGRRGEKAL